MLALCFLRLHQFEESRRELEALFTPSPEHLWGRLVQAALHAQCRELDAAFMNLEIASLQGYNPRLLLHEPLFEPLWADPRFDSLLQGQPLDNDDDPRFGG
jgi:hypothetical protein